jgi:DNA-binding HxlR family transcriptional regulator
LILESDLLAVISPFFFRSFSILYRLNRDTMRYGELRKDIPHISDKMLTSQQRELESGDFIDRKVFAVVPPSTEYSLTEKGRGIIPLIMQIREIGLEMMREEGVKEK